MCPRWGEKLSRELSGEYVWRGNVLHSVPQHRLQSPSCPSSAAGSPACCRLRRWCIALDERSCRHLVALSTCVYVTASAADSGAVQSHRKHERTNIVLFMSATYRYTTHTYIDRQADRYIETGSDVGGKWQGKQTITDE